MNTITDQTGRTIYLNKSVERIVSLVPSQTELLFDLGLEAKVVGITKFCIHPPQWFRNKVRVGGTKSIDFELINQLQPDLIIANKEENEQRQIEELEKKFTVWISDIKNFSDAFDMIQKIGLLTDRKEKSEYLINEIKKYFAAFVPLKTKLKVVYLIWKNPWMAAGHHTFISSMLEFFGLTNAVQLSSRYPVLNDEEIQQLNPDFIFLSSEPFPFKENHIEHWKRVCPYAKTILVDGELFSWYGSRMLKAVPYLNQLKKSIESSL